MVFEYILLAILLLTAIFLIVAVGMQKSGKEGLSGTIVGGTETYYGKDDSVKKDKKLVKWTIIISIIFALAVAIVYIVQPDYTDAQGGYAPDSWKNFAGDYSDIIDSPYEVEAE